VFNLSQTLVAFAARRHPGRAASCTDSTARRQAAQIPIGLCACSSRRHSRSLVAATMDACGRSAWCPKKVNAAASRWCAKMTGGHAILRNAFADCIVVIVAGLSQA
jgi:hypothetical protein